MAEYISKQSVLDYLNGYLNSIGECGADSLLFDRGQRRALINSIQDILAVKAADVQPVVHAYWIELPKALNPNENPCKCSNCGHILSFMNGYPKSKYCDDCGAKMDIIYEDDKIRAIKVTGWGNNTRNLTNEKPIFT